MENHAHELPEFLHFLEELIEEIAWLQDKIFLRGFVFGLVHVGIMLIAYYTGWSINRLLKIVSNISDLSSSVSPQLLQIAIEGLCLSFLSLLQTKKVLL